MAAASLPSSSLCLPIATRTHGRVTSLGPKPERWRRHPGQRGATIQLQRREISRRPIWFGRLMAGGDGVSGVHSVQLPPSLTEMIMDFYSSINKKDLSKLRELVADDCVLEDLAFPKPFKGKQVHHFLKELTEAMGKHVRFSIDHVCEKGGSSVAVMWHLEWNEELIPFTKGCSFYECSRNGEKLHIKSGRIFVESPVKPGEIVLELLKFISKLFDKFPKLAEKFLQKPNAMIQIIARAYKIFVEPFILPVLVYYTHAWTFAARILSCVLNILQNLLKFLM